jgi:apolipoprotein D and lipocalin family protein
MRANKPSSRPLETVNYVDLSRYQGTWYEIARYPNRFQKGCRDSRATYTLLKDGKVSVLNECYDEKTGKLRNANGKAWVIDKITNAKLKVSFLWPFSGDYWIIDLGENYEYAVVGHPTRKYLWILSRKNRMEEDLFQIIVGKLKIQGYDPDRLIRREPKEQDNES